MSRANRITDNDALLNNLHRLMWDASDAIMTVYEADDFGETLKIDESPVTRRARSRTSSRSTWSGWTRSPAT